MTATTLVLGVAGMTAIIVVRYLLSSGGFAWWTRARGIVAGPADPGRRRAQITAEVRWSLLSALIYAVPAGLTAVAWREGGLTAIQSGMPTALQLAWQPFAILAYLAIHDAWFYWTHRAMHHRRLFGPVHAAHHASRPPTAWAAMSFSPWEALSGAILLPALAWMIPIHWAALLVVLSVATVMGVTNHMGWEMFPKRHIAGTIGRLFITASHHEVHHKRYGCNYGLYFRYWDRLCGTDGGLARELLGGELLGEEFANAAPGGARRIAADGPVAVGNQPDRGSAAA